MLTTFGGKLKDLRTFLTHERIPDGWQPRTRGVMGNTILQFNLTVFSVELGIRESGGYVATDKDARTRAPNERKHIDEM